MLKKILLQIILLAISVISFGQANKDSVNERDKSIYGVSDNPESVSLVKLIANPEKYHGKVIAVIGYLHLEFECDAIYLHKEDFKASIYENSFWVNFSAKLAREANLKKFSSNYVILLGTFNAKEKGHMGMFGGTIDNVVRLEIWKLRN